MSKLCYLPRVVTAWVTVMLPLSVDDQFDNTVLFVMPSVDVPFMSSVSVVAFSTADTVVIVPDELAVAAVLAVATVDNNVIAVETVSPDGYVEMPLDDICCSFEV